MCVASIALAFPVFVVCICCFDVPCPRLGRDLGVALGDVVAIAEKFCDKGRWDFYGQALQRGVACSQQVDTQVAQSLHDCLRSEVTTGSHAGEQPRAGGPLRPAVLRLGRVARC